MEISHEDFKMTKEEAWIEWIKTLEEAPEDIEDPSVTIEDCQDAFEWAWTKAIESLSSKEEKIPFEGIIQSTNNILGKKFKATLAHKSFIRARWREGMREDDFKRVCRIKKEQWGQDPKLAIYLRPETLFGTKMDSYNNEPEPKRKKTILNHMGVEVEVDE